MQSRLFVPNQITRGNYCLCMFCILFPPVTHGLIFLIITDATIWPRMNSYVDLPLSSAKQHHNLRIHRVLQLKAHIRWPFLYPILQLELILQ